MPSIKKEDKQIQALNEIIDELNEIKVLNGAISGKFRIAVVVEQSEKKTLKVRLDAKDTRRILPVVIARKARISKDIRAKAVKYRIDLSVEDLELMDGPVEAVTTGTDQNLELASGDREESDISDDLEMTGDFPGNGAPPGAFM